MNWDEAGRIVTMILGGLLIILGLTGGRCN